MILRSEISWIVDKLRLKEAKMEENLAKLKKI